MPNKNITVLGFDFGIKQIGVASGQTLTCTANPLTVIKNHRDTINWQGISQVINEWQPQALVVGWPLNMDGSESDLCKRVKKFSRQLEGRFNLPVHLSDERLSSHQVKTDIASENNYQQNPIDDKAAAIILQSWLNEQV